MRFFKYLLNLVCSCIVIGFGAAHLYSMYYEGINWGQVAIVLCGFWIAFPSVVRALVYFCYENRKKGIFDYDY